MFSIGGPATRRSTDRPDGESCRPAGNGAGLRTELMRGSAGSLAVGTAGAVLSLLVSMLLARLLGVEGFGTYSFAVSVAMLLAIPAQSGFPPLVVRETAAACTTGRWAEIRGLWRWSGGVVVVVATVAGAGLLIVVSVAGPGWEPDRRATLTAAAFLVPLVALANLRGAALRGLRRTVLGQLPERIVRPLTLLLLVGGCVVFVAEDTLSAAAGLWCHVAAAGVAFVLGLIWLRHAQTPELASSNAAEYRRSAWMRSALPLTLTGGLVVVNEQLDLMLLGLLRSDSEVGLYRAAVQGGLIIMLGMQSLKIVVMPQIARLFTEKDSRRLQRLATRSAQAAFGIALVPGSILVVWGEPIMGWAFGSSFTVGHQALAIIVVGQLLNAAMGFVGVLLNMTGFEFQVTRAMLISTAANLVLALILIPMFGLEGAAVARVSQLVIWNLILVSVVRRELGIHPYALPLSFYAFRGLK